MAYASLAEDHDLGVSTMGSIFAFGKYVLMKVRCSQSPCSLVVAMDDTVSDERFLDVLFLGDRVVKRSSVVSFGYLPSPVHRSCGGDR